MYPFQLGYHLKYKRLCRIPLYSIPVGTVKIIRYREKDERFLRKPYSHMNGELDSRYWSIPRWCDLERENVTKNN